MSFAHGSNDGQKGMGLIMLILIGVMPTAYALNKAVTPDQTSTFVAVARHASTTLAKYADPAAQSTDPRADVEAYVRTHKLTPATIPALGKLTDTIAEVAQAGGISSVPQNLVDNVRNNMYVASEAIRLMERRRRRRSRSRTRARSKRSRSRWTARRNSSRPG